ncbi:cytochrome c oxidase subunit II [Calothrix sp. NIES-3974]|uniref:cytochrome c oxidase subunit II n=1 Tax=Calothrix sp. NIES-3974 TaxID=2005462 RepID=UPI000B61C361|nr:cytochrome c oxidase subunit II [Calothrix sp. NIES-3974]BAZ06677.1 cytochrome c oxidase subunit II [Calothrix sp. NIES-3974]
MKIRSFLLLTVFLVVLTGVSLWMGKQAYSWFPPQAAAESHLIDELFSFLVVLGTFIFCGVVGMLLYSVAFYRVPAGDTSDGPPIEGNITLEVVWTAIPILLVVWIATYSYQIYEQMAIRGPMEVVHLHIPEMMKTAYADTNSDAIAEPKEKISVIAKQWAWEFHYPYKNVTSTELHLPTNQRVQLALTSEDVLHGFYIPAFRLKQDIIPKRTIDFEFTPMREGTYRLMDSQFSGAYFATMDTKVVVQSPDDYKHWLNKAASQKPTPAKNQAVWEYTQAQQKSAKSGWPTVVPAAPPVVNFSG